MRTRRNDQPSGWKRWLVLLGFPFLVRSLCLLELSGEPFFECLFIDARTYHEMASALANGTYRPNSPFWQPPGYPLLLALIYKFLGTDANVARWVQIVLGSASAWLVFLIAGSVFGRRAAWIAWACFALYGPIVLYDLQLLNVNLGILLFLVALLGLLRAADIVRRNDRGVKASTVPLLAGLAAGASAITIGNMAILIPLGVMWLLWRGVRRGTHDGLRKPAREVVKSQRSRLIVPILFLFSALTPIAAVTAYNQSVSGEAVVVSYNAGVNFWIGNNPDYESTVGIRPGRAWIRLTDEPRTNGYTGFRDQSRYFFEKARRWILENPADYVRLLAHKMRLFFRGDEILRNQELYPFREVSQVASALLWVKGVAFPWGVFFPLGCAGVVLALAGFRRHRGRDAGAGTKAPGEPGAAAGTKAPGGSGAAAGTKAPGGSGAAAGTTPTGEPGAAVGKTTNGERSAAGVANPSSAATYATDGAMVGVAWNERQRAEMSFLLLVAVCFAASVIAYFVTARYRLPIVPIVLCFAAFAIDRCLHSIGAFLRSRKNAGPSHFSALRPLAIALAIAGFMGVLSNSGVPAPARDFNSDAHYDLGYWYQLANDRGMAKEHYERALTLDSKNQEARNNLAGLLAEGGDLTRAADLLVMVLVDYPKDARVLRNLGSIRLQQLRPYDAGWYFTQILLRDPSDARAQSSLAQAEAMAEELETRRLAENADDFLTSLGEASRLAPENQFLQARLARLRQRSGNVD